MGKLRSGALIFKYGLGFLVSYYGIRIILTVIGILIVFMLVYPILFAILTSLVRGQIIITELQDIFKYGLTLDHYLSVITDEAFIRALTTSITVSILTIIMAVLVITPAAYGFSRFKFWGKDTMLFTYLVLSQVGGGFGLSLIHI